MTLKVVLESMSLKDDVNYSVRRLIGSRIIESAAYYNQILVIPLYN
jgi:hypothetical protein